MDKEVFLFSYGTLQQTAIQRHLFGRILEGQQDELKGFELKSIRIPGALTVTEYPIIYRSSNNSAVMEGVAFKIQEAELSKVDQYEGEHYKRVSLKLESGRQAFVYISAY